MIIADGSAASAIIISADCSAENLFCLKQRKYLSKIDSDLPADSGSEIESESES